jgi:hypothetical protein
MPKTYWDWRIDQCSWQVGEAPIRIKEQNEQRMMLGAVALWQIITSLTNVVTTFRMDREPLPKGESSA